MAADRVALRGLVFDPEVAPPWDKAAWRNPGTRHTSTAGAGPEPGRGGRARVGGGVRAGCLVKRTQRVRAWL